MKEIKYRAWDEETNCMYLHAKLLKDRWSYEDLCRPATKINVMQFTGLLDKNGKEIYEGDIVNALDDDSRFGQRYEKMKVIFNNGEFGIGETTGTLGLKFLSDIEIIGNIYENPILQSRNG